MDKKNTADLQELLAIWQTFQYDNQLSNDQIAAFKQYAQMLVEWNEKFNITAITDYRDIIVSHFQDSLSLASCTDLTKIKGMADVGAGGGFPGIPLKIVYPHIFMVLIEVNQKKVHFLREVIAQLKLSNIEVVDLDWRTFIRKTQYPIDLFCARASLSMQELLRVFKGDSMYDDAQLVYWASRHYEPEKEHQSHVSRSCSYLLYTTERRLFFFNK